jgi:hypothetical protein
MLQDLDDALALESISCYPLQDTIDEGYTLVNSREEK